MTQPANIFDRIPPAGPGESIDNLLKSSGLRIERIISHGQASPPGFWYDQPEDEWVLVLKGAARLEFDGGHTVEMKPGSFIHLAAHQRHRVAWTASEGPTIWIAVHFCGIPQAPTIAQ